MKIIKIIFTAVVFLIATNVIAQNQESEKRATFGLKLRLNISNVNSTDGKNFDNTNSKTGLNAGITLDYSFTPIWYLVTGLEYSSKGVKVDLGGKSYDQDITAAYVQLPLCLGIKSER